MCEKMRRKILYISMCMPFNKAFHAGGKTFNYYINSFANDENNEITLIAKVLPDEEKFIETVNSKIKKYLVATPKQGLHKCISYAKSLNSKYNPCYKYGNVLTKEIYDQIEKKLHILQDEGYRPDVVILEWTSMLLFIEQVKKYFPNAKYVASEHDVSFLGYLRKYEKAEGFLDKKIKKIAYDSLKYHELNAINKCDLVVTHNLKDKKLLIKNGVETEKTDVIVPYYDKFSVTKREPNKRDIIYYGAMNRIENSTSAIWFAENVLPRLADCKVRFIIIGNKPPKELMNMANDKIIVTGFVEDPSLYFEHAMCLAAPLLLGAGIKVKIIEALSSGVPVLTNDIGIEGIDAEDGKEYFHCEKPEEYEMVIRKIISGEIDTSVITSNAKRMIEEKYNLENSSKNYRERVYQLVENRGK